MSVPDSVKKEATKCTKNFRCLETGQCGDPVLCDVHYADGKNVVFLHSCEEHDCDYRMSFGGKYICRCPVHYEILKKNDVL